MLTIEEHLNADVNSVQELLLKEAEMILKKTYTGEEIETFAELSSLGLKNSKEYIRYKDWQRANQVTHYVARYPMNKFITEGAIKKICKKYGLLLAEVGDYKGEIPFDNQKAIVNFRVHEDDIINYTSSWMLSTLTFRMMDDGGITRVEDEKPKEIEDKSPMKKASNLKIIAPPSKLKMKGKKVKGHTLIKKDPIVLQPVKDGYLIVTAWGLEANDDSIKNPRHN